jgi:PmbA protein
MTRPSRDDLASGLLSKARKAGATAGDVLIVEGESSNVQVRMGRVDKLSNAREKRLGLRLFFGRRTAVVSTADFSRDSLNRLVSTGAALARSTSEDPYSGLPDAGGSEGGDGALPSLDLWDPGLKDVTMEDKIKMATEAESAALAEDPRITNSEGGEVSAHTREITYANTSGFSGTYGSSLVSLSVVPIATGDGGMQRDYWYSTDRKLHRLDSPESVGREAARRTVRRLGARKIQTGSYPVVFDPDTASELLGSLSAAVSGYAVYKGASYLIGQLGRSVASREVTVVDDATLPSGLASRPFDAEGLPARRTVVVENGLLRSYLLDSYSGRKLSLPSTASAARSIGDVPGVSSTNFYMAPGRRTPEEIIRSVQRGLYLVEMIGFGVNLVTGDYSRGAVGIWIENGELAYPVEGITVAGNLREIFAGIEMIGNDLAFRRSINSPTLLVSGMTVAGD